MYLKKKDLLERLKQKRQECADECDVYREGAICEVIEEIQSGRFDVDDSEIQRLRAALEKARTYIFNGYDLGYIDDREGCTKPLLHQIDEALSTTTEPINAAKVERVREGDGNDA